MKDTDDIVAGPPTCNPSATPRPPAVTIEPDVVFVASAVPVTTILSEVNVVATSSVFEVRSPAMCAFFEVSMSPPLFSPPDNCVCSSMASSGSIKNVSTQLI